MRALAKLAIENGRKPIQIKRERPLSVSGVGKGSQKCTHNCKAPIVLTTTGSSEPSYLSGFYEAPVIPDSMIPGLVGLESAIKSRAIIDTVHMRYYMCGPADFDLLENLPSGTECVQCERSPSGHMVMPCAHFQEIDKEQRHGGLTVDKEQLVLPVVSTSSSSAASSSRL